MQYPGLDLEVVRFITEDVITTSFKTENEPSELTDEEVTFVN